MKKAGQWVELERETPWCLRGIIMFLWTRANIPSTRAVGVGRNVFRLVIVQFHSQLLQLLYGVPEQEKCAHCSSHTSISGDLDLWGVRDSKLIYTRILPISSYLLRSFLWGLFTILNEKTSACSNSIRLSSILHTLETRNQRKAELDLLLTWVVSPLPVTAS